MQYLGMLVVLVLAGCGTTALPGDGREEDAARAAEAAADASGRRAGFGAVAPTTVFRGVRLFDGTKVVPETTVVVVSGLITAIGEQADLPAGATVVDGTGKTLLPGLIDAHAHIDSVSQLKQAALFGVTTELDMAGLPQFSRSLRKQQSTGRATDRADLFSAGHPLTVKGGHPTQIAVYRDIPVIASAAQTPAFVDERIAEGSDYIKLVYDDAVVYGYRPAPTLSREMLSAAIRQAHRRGKLAVAHVSAHEFAREAIEEGIDGLVHLFVDRRIDESLLKLAVQRKAFVIPTLTVLESDGGKSGGAALVRDADLAPYLNSRNIASLNASFPRAPGSKLDLNVVKQTVRDLNRAGVPILAGSDAPNPGTDHGVSMHRELELLVEAGLTPLDALQAATSLPAERFRLLDRGRIAPGLRADLLLVDGDPTSDIRATRKIVGVWKGGIRIDREPRRQPGLPAAKPSAGNGIVSDFEENEIASRFGAGWVVSTDQLEGGTSTAKLSLVSPGAANSHRAMKIVGRIEGKSPSRWAGALFYPGTSEFAPADLSARKAISFWAKGDGKSYAVVVFTERGGYVPASRFFISGDKWKRYRFSFAQLGTDGSDLTGLFIGGGDDAGPFELLIDDVRFD